MKFSIIMILTLATSLLFAAPTANENFVVYQAANAYTNALNEAKAYTDVSKSVVSVNGQTGAVVITASSIGAASSTNATQSGKIGKTIVYGSSAPSMKWGVDYALNAQNAVNAQILSSAISVLENTKNVAPYSRSFGFEQNDEFNSSGGNLVLRKKNIDGTQVIVNTNAWKSDIDLLVPKTRTVNGHSLSQNVVISASDVGAFSSSAGASLQNQVSAIGAHLNAEDARFVVTNCNSSTQTPEAYVEIKLPDQSWSRIWSEMTRWNWLTGHYLPTNFYTKAQMDAELVTKCDRAWGAYDSDTGAFAPNDFTWISSPKIAIAANLAYQRTVTSEGAIWVLESHGTVWETGGATNGFWRISDDEGNSIFEIVKGDKRTVGADASSCQIVGAFVPTKLQIDYSIDSDVHPTIYVCNNLSTHLWKAETDNDCLANVVWSGSSGSWVAQVQGKAAQSALFVKATYEVGGDTYIKNSAPVSMQNIIINGVKYAVGTATISGNTVLTLTVAQ